MRKDHILIGIGLFIAIGAAMKMSGVGELDRSVVSLNQDLPRMVDENTRLDAVEKNNKILIYKYTFVNLPGDLENSLEIKEEIHSNLKKLYCNDPKMYSLKSNNIRIYHAYRNSSGKLLIETYVERSDCSI